MKMILRANCNFVRKSKRSDSLFKFLIGDLCIPFKEYSLYSRDWRSKIYFSSSFSAGLRSSVIGRRPIV